MNAKSNLPRRRAMRLRGYDYSQPGAYFVTTCVQHRKCLFGAITDGKMQLNETGQIVIECWNHITQHFPPVELRESVIMPNHFHGIISWGISDTRDPQPIVGARSPRPPEDTNNRRGEVASSNDTNRNRRGEVSSPVSDEPENTTNRRGEVSSPNDTNRNRRGKAPSPASDEPENTTNRRGEVSSPALGKIVAYFKYQCTKHINQRHNRPGTRIWQRDYYDHIIRDDEDLQRLRQYIQNNPMKWELDQLHPDNPSRW